MGKNTGNMDRLFRLVLGAALVIVAWMSWAALGTVWGWTLAIVGVVLLATSAMGFCPLYRIVGVSTCKTK